MVRSLGTNLLLLDYYQSMEWGGEETREGNCVGLEGAFKISQRHLKCQRPERSWGTKYSHVHNQGDGAAAVILSTASEVLILKVCEEERGFCFFNTNSTD